MTRFLISRETAKMIGAGIDRLAFATGTSLVGPGLFPPTRGLVARPIAEIPNLFGHFSTSVYKALFSPSGFEPPSGVTTLSPTPPGILGEDSRSSHPLFDVPTRWGRGEMKHEGMALATIKIPGNSATPPDIVNVIIERTSNTPDPGWVHTQLIWHSEEHNFAVTQDVVLAAQFDRRELSPPRILQPLQGSQWLSIAFGSRFLGHLAEDSAGAALDIPNNFDDPATLVQIASLYAQAKGFASGKLFLEATSFPTLWEELPEESQVTWNIQGHEVIAARGLAWHSLRKRPLFLHLTLLRQTLGPTKSLYPFAIMKSTSVPLTRNMAILRFSDGQPLLNIMESADINTRQPFAGPTSILLRTAKRLQPKLPFDENLEPIG